VRLNGGEVVETPPSRTDDELPNAVTGGCPVGGHLCEALVVMVIAGQDEVGMRGIQVVPERTERRIVAMLA
jgi:hypothetical protein